MRLKHEDLVDNIENRDEDFDRFVFHCVRELLVLHLHIFSKEGAQRQKGFLTFCAAQYGTLSL